ncbi:type II secretion system F family protein [Spongiibacter marinus]|uniref:type II secretion system F family protein n=2 Tax=Spongiibacter marinus TaxID=354246 RepID=UPI0004233009|nr:type II secretion system F family protein [Spongiibacter marinus]
MNDSWWIDFVFVSLLIGIAYIAFRLRAASQDLGDDTEVDFEEQQRFSLYPSKRIRQAGLAPKTMRLSYWLLKFTLLLLGPTLLLELSAGQVALWLLAAVAVALFFVFDVWLLMVRRKRRQQIRRSLNFFVNLLVVYLKSGMSLGKAFDQAAEYGLGNKNPLSQEISLLSKEIEAGRGRDEAFAKLAQRTGVEDLEKIAAVLRVGFQVGSPVAETLAAQAELLRAKQTQLGTELVNRKSMEAMLPMLLVCIPMFVVLVLFPAGSQVYEVLQMMKDLF